MPSTKLDKARTKVLQQGHGGTFGFKVCPFYLSHKCSKPQTDNGASADFVTQAPVVGGNASQ